MLDQVKFPESTFYVPQIDSVNRADDDSVDSLFGEALASPVDFPTLDQFVLEGDCVAVVLLGNLPEPVKVLASIVHHVAALVPKANIVAVISPVHAGEFDALAQETIASYCADSDIEFCFHDPTDQGGVACIANNLSGEGVYVNRKMFDADVVIPVGSPVAGSGQQDSFYPEFSNAEVLARFRRRDDDESRRQLAAEVRQAEQNLGAEFSVLVVRGPGGRIVDVRAGNRHSISSGTRAGVSSMWSIECQRDGELVVATIEGSSHQQTWDDVFQAMAAAAAASESVRQIVVCSAIDTEPEPQQMDVLQLQFEVDQDAKRRILDDLTGVRRVIPGILESTSVYLMSRLPQDTVEEAGLGYIQSDREIQRIVDRAASGILLRDAHLCRVGANG